MMKDLTKFLMFCIGSLIIVFGMVIYTNVNGESSSYRFVSSSYSKYCYPSNAVNSEIKHPIHYQTEAQCGKPLK